MRKRTFQPALESLGLRITPSDVTGAASAAAAVTPPMDPGYASLISTDPGTILTGQSPYGIPYFIEANPLPGLAPVTSDLVILAEGYGFDHAALVRMILGRALLRVGRR